VDCCDERSLLIGSFTAYMLCAPTGKYLDSLR
jgi:hypothetical protein